jgi:hypothetical protein
MVYFQTKNPNLGKVWRITQRKMLIYFMSIRYILRPFAKFYGHLVYFLVIWYILHILVICSKKNLATLVLRPIKKTLTIVIFPVFEKDRF